MRKINLKTDNSVNYNYRDEDTVYFVNFKNLIIAAVSASYVCTLVLGIFRAIQYYDSKIGLIILNDSLNIGLIIFQIFVIFNYRFLIKKRLKKFSWLSCLFILIHSIFYIIILNIILIGGPNLMHNILS